MTGATRRRALLGAVALVVSACSGSSSGGGATAKVGDGRTWRVESASKEQLTAAAPIVQARLERLGVSGAGVAADGSGLTTAVAVDPLAMEAAGRVGPTELWTVTATTVGACPAGDAAGVPSLPVGRRCHQLGARLAGTEAVQSAVPALQPGLGWSVELFIDGGGYAALRAALTSAGGAPVAVVADRQVIAVVATTGVLGLHARIAPGLTEREARRLAYALLVTGRSPVRVTVPDPGPEPGPAPDADFWLSALSVNVCGTWLPDAPATPDASGIHSHGDGFIYAHPQTAGEANANATVGRWLGHGSWTAKAGELKLWDGATHRNGDTCPDGRAATVRWWVDGAEQQGDPESHRIGNGEAITLSFNPAGVDPGPGPAAARLPLPDITPEA